MSDSVLERKVLYTGKPFIRQGEEHARAYIIQDGFVRSFVEEDGEKVIVDEFGPGRLIAEICLMSDEPMTMSYEAVENTTVIALSRLEFQKKIAKIDENVAMILEQIMLKFNFQYAKDIEEARRLSTPDPMADKLVMALTQGLSAEKKESYEQALKPHVNAMLREIAQIKKAKASDG